MNHSAASAGDNLSSPYAYGSYEIFLYNFIFSTPGLRGLFDVLLNSFWISVHVNSLFV